MPFELLHIGESVSAVSSTILGFIPSPLYISGSTTACLITYIVNKINGKITYRSMPRKKKVRYLGPILQLGFIPHWHSTQISQSRRKNSTRSTGNNVQSLNISLCICFRIINMRNTGKLPPTIINSCIFLKTFSDLKKKYFFVLKSMGRKEFSN